MLTSIMFTFQGFLVPEEAFYFKIQSIILQTWLLLFSPSNLKTQHVLQMTVFCISYSHPSLHFLALSALWLRPFLIYA